MVKVDAQSVALGITVGEQARLQHLVGREADARHDIGRREGGLLNLCKIIVGPAIELDHAHFDQRIVCLRPDLGEIEGIVLVHLRLLVGHDLDEHRPAREVAAFDRVEQIAAVALAIVGDECGCLGIGEVLDALLRAEMELDPNTFLGGVDHRKGVTAETVHMPEALRDAPVGHDDRHLVQRFGQQRPEIPVVIGRAQAGARVALDGVVEIRKTQRVAEEKDGRVIADDVPVAFLRVELQRKAADVAFRVGRAPLAGNRREACEHRRRLADLREYLRLGIAADVVRDGEAAVGAPPFRVHPPLRDDLAVKMRHLLDKPDVLEQRGAARPCSHDVEIVGHRSPGCVCHGGTGICHDLPPVLPTGWSCCRPRHRVLILCAYLRKSRATDNRHHPVDQDSRTLFPANKSWTFSQRQRATSEWSRFIPSPSGGSWRDIA